MNERMKEAIELADKCWGKAYRADAAFVERYLELAEQLLLDRPMVMGDEFRANCQRLGLNLPSKLHHNTWVSGPRAIWQIGWIHPVMKVEPSQKHNHMPEVTLWRSMIYGQDPDNRGRRQFSLFD